jgi:parallel beta-helix repeat protein
MWPTFVMANSIISLPLFVSAGLCMRRYQFLLTSFRSIQGAVSVGAGPTTTGQNGIQVGFGATGKVQNNTVADDDFNGDPSNGTGSGILIFDSSNVTITGNSVTNTQNGIPIVTDGAFPADHNTVSNNHVSDTHLGDGIDLCSNQNTVSGNTVLSKWLGRNSPGQ